MGQKRYSLTKQQKNFFVKRVQYWQQALGFLEVLVEVRYDHFKNPHNYASWAYHDIGSFLEIVLNTSWGKKPTNDTLDAVAFHEIFEPLYLREFRNAMIDKYSDEYINEVTHKALRRAENTIRKAMGGLKV